MRHVEITAGVPCTSAQHAYEVLSDFERYPDLTSAVRSVTIDANDDGTVSTIWEVNFRNGVLRWTEADRLDDRALTIAFDQTDGDFHSFSGEWTVDGQADGCTVRFAASFDLGMPSLGRIIDPIAENALRENITLILSGLFGPDIKIDAHADAADATPAAPRLTFVSAA